MSTLEDEVRVVLSTHSQRVPSTAELPVGVAERVATMRRQQRSGRIAAAGCVLAMLLVSLPLLMAASDHDRTALRASGTALGGHRAALHEAAPAVRTLPANYLNWQLRGQRPPGALIAYPLAYYSAKTGAAADQLHMAPLWAGRLSGGSWVAVVQVWRDGDANATIGVFGDDADTDSPYWITQGTLSFTHGATGGTKLPAGAGIQQIRVVTVALGNGLVLALGAPDVSSIWYAADGVHFAPEHTSDGVALITRQPRTVNGTDVDLVQARTAAGVPVTSADAVAVRDAALLGRPAASDGWGLPDIS